MMSELIEIKNHMGMNDDLWTIFRNSMTDTVPQLSQHLDTLTSGSRLYDLGVSSVEIYEVVGSIEDALDIVVPTDQLSRIKTFGELGGLIQNLVERKVE
ncbi:MAG TPA: acyl carrier protein [Cellvibrio sp.]|nr:acyl carrier protein [Cellvibrio sp.]